MALVGLWLRRLRDEALPTIGIVALVLVTALCVSLGPRVFEERSDEALRSELATAPSFERTTVIYETLRPRFVDQPLAEFEDMTDALGQLERQLPADVRRLVAGRTALIETPLWETFAGTGLNSVIRLRIGDSIFEHIRLTSGRLPEGVPTAARDERPTAPSDTFAWAYEAILPDSAAREMGVGPGSRLSMGAWLNDPLNIGVNAGAVLLIVGTYELADPNSEYWVSDATVGGWRLHTIGTNDWLETTALLGPESYQTVVANSRGTRMSLLYQYRYFSDTSRLRAGDLPATMEALRRLEAAVPRTGNSEIAGDTRLTSGLLRLLETHQRAWQAAAAVLAFIGLGALAIAISTLAAVAIAASAGRRRVATLLRSRGGSPGQLLAVAGLEAALVCLPATLVGLAIALALAPGAVGPEAVLLASVVATVSTLILVAIVRRGSLAGDGTAAKPRGTRVTARRLVAETSLVVGALGAAWLLRERGVAAQAGGGPDLLIAAVLALVGIAAGVLAMRIYPLPARLVGWLIAKRRDLLPVLAVRRAVRGGSSAAVLLLLVASASVGTFASATLVQLEEGARAAAWNEIGAEFRVTSSTGVLPADLEPSSLPGVDAAAEASLRAIATDHGPAWLLSYDAPGLADVVAGTPAAVDPPAREPLANGPDPLPAVVGGLPLAVGDALTATINQRAVGIVVSEVRPTFPGVPSGEAYVAVAAHLLDGALPAGAPRASMLLVRATPSAATDLRTAIGAVGSWLVLDSRAENAAARLGAPVMNALRALIAALAVLALGYAAIAVGAALMLAVAAQREETAHLRALGVARSGRGWLALFEYGPAALSGYLIGAALGLALFAFILPALGLASIIGSTVELSVGIQPIHLLALLGAVLFILVIGWLGGVVAQRDTDPVTAIRRGIE